MATTQKMKEGVFLISWESSNHHGLITKTVEIEEISLTFQLSYTIDVDHRINKLTMQIVPISTRIRQGPDILECTELSYHVSVLSFKPCCRKQELELIDSKWEVYLFNTNLQSAMIFDIVVDFTNNLPCPLTKRVVDYVLNLWESKTLADVTFKFKEKDIQAHTSILASGSPVLAAMFQNDFKGNLEKVVEIKDIESPVFEFMLRFFYTGDLELGNVDVAQLFVVADKYGVDSLKKECALTLAQNLTVENVAEFFKLSHLYPELMIQKPVTDFLTNNFKMACFREDWKEIMKSYPDIAIQVMQFMTSK